MERLDVFFWFTPHLLFPPQLGPFRLDSNPDGKVCVNSILIAHLVGGVVYVFHSALRSISTECVCPQLYI